MKRKNATRNALLMSVFSLLLCVTMLVGTTYAWFTDTASTGINTITSGNLDLEVYYAYPSDVVDGDIPADAWKPVKADESVFNEAALWEPGYTEVVFFKFDNAGSLSFQYQFQVDILNETLGKTKDGADIQLSNYIQAYAAVGADWSYKGNLFTDRESVVNPQYAPEVFSDTLYNAANMGVNRADDPYTNALSLDHWQWLEPDETTYVTLALWMPTTVGNEANHNGTDIPSIDLGINVLATQYNWEEEKDSFDHNYDMDAEFPELVSPPLTTIEQVQEAFNNGGNFVLGANLAFEDTLTVPADVEVVLDLAGHDIKVNGDDNEPALNIKGTMTLRNTSGDPSEIVNINMKAGANQAAIRVPHGGTLNFESGTILVGGTYAANGIYVGGWSTDDVGTVNINGGTIIVDGTSNKAGVVATHGAVINMNGGEIIVNATGNSHGIQVLMGTATVNLNAGKITVKNAESFGVCAASEGSLTLNIENGFVFDCSNGAQEYGGQEGNVPTVNDNRG